jgi:hypothetical protein
MTHDLTPDEILDAEDNKRLSQMIAIKKHIYAFINQKELINFILHLVDGSQIASFERAADRRFLNLRNLSLSLKLDIRKMAQLYPEVEIFEKSDRENRDSVKKNRESIMRELIVMPVSNMMNTMLRAILHGEVPDDFPYADWMLKILPDDFETLADSINNFSDTGANKERLEKDFFFMFSLSSAFVFPPEDSSEGLNDDTGFTLEFLL